MTIDLISNLPVFGLWRNLETTHTLGDLHDLHDDDGDDGAVFR